jgi:hypothetical protein
LDEKGSLNPQTSEPISPKKKEKKLPSQKNRMFENHHSIKIFYGLVGFFAGLNPHPSVFGHF